MTTLLPKDADNHLIPALRLKPGGAHHLEAADISIRNQAAFDIDTKVVAVYATGPVYMRFGDEDVGADENDHFYPAGLYYDFAISGGGTKASHHSHLAVLAAGAPCFVYVSEKE